MELEGLDDLLNDYSVSEGISEDIFSEAAAQGQKQMNSLRNLGIGIVGIAICIFLISVVLKKMNKNRM